MVGEFKEIAGFEPNITSISEAIDGEGDNPHEGKWSWSTDTPDFLYCMIICCINEKFWEKREFIGILDFLCFRNNSTVFFEYRHGYFFWERIDIEDGHG